MKLHSLHDLLVDQLKDLYSAENQIIKALPKMARAASSPDLASGFEEHLEQTRQHAERLEQICEQLDVTPKGKQCVAIEGLIEEGKELMEEDAAPAVLDAGLIAGAQKVEHYEMASYGSARAWAEQLGMNDVAQLLQQTLDEEKATDAKLTQLAEQMVNQQAEAAEGQLDNGAHRGRRMGNGAATSRRKAGARR
jgi:ferritin-like metal-binding protein YciE